MFQADETWWHIKRWHLRIILYIFNTFLPSSLLALIYIHMYFFIIHVHLLPLWRGFLFNPRTKPGYLRPSAHLVNYMKEWRFLLQIPGFWWRGFLSNDCGFPFLVSCSWKLLLGKSPELGKWGEYIKGTYCYCQTTIFTFSTKIFSVTFYYHWYPLVFPLHHCIVLSTTQ